MVATDLHKGVGYFELVPDTNKNKLTINLLLFSSKQGGDDVIWKARIRHENEENKSVLKVHSSTVS